MRIPLSWLGDYVDLALPLEALCHRLTMAGLETAPSDGGRVLESEVTPNRPDWLSVLGVAWEIAALCEMKLRLPDTAYQELGAAIDESVDITIADPDLCRRYSASLVRGVSVGPSPRWMQERLLAAGMRPINNIVDITNYVMLEYGQPLHAFDWDKIKGGKVIIRRAGQGERLTTLDGVNRALTPEILVIASAKEAIAVAGVMGGSDTEVSEATTNILLESASFSGRSVRRTSQKLGMRTEASIRFERGISAGLTVPALRRATRLFLEIAGGQAARDVKDLYPSPQECPEIRISQDDLSRTLGVDWALEQARRALELLGFATRNEGAALVVQPPLHRTDVMLMEDVVEEVARIIGYDAIPTTTLRGPLPEPKEDPLRSLEEEVRDILTGYGLQDIITYSLIGSRALEQVRYRGPEPIRLANPMSREQEVLRPTLRTNLLSGLATNQRYGEEGVWLFEAGKVFWPREGDLPDERRVVGAAICGPLADRSWLKKQREVDFYVAKGLIEGLLGHLGVQGVFEPAGDPFFIEGRAASVQAGNVNLGAVGEVHPVVLEQFDLQPRAVCYFEIDLERLLPHFRHVQRFQDLPRYPAVSQDLSILLDKGVASGMVLEIVQSFSLVRRVTIFDVFTGEQLPPGKKSLSFSILYQSPERTLTDEEVALVHRSIVERLGRELGASLRG
ncbi:MAG: phenylalanine--tRNA ligase subunit beta [Dehalococcoidia bacterium]|nr:phenylalanine--tRNA ligase subunit beta [Dehalococcoidia bacterium]